MRTLTGYLFIIALLPILIYFTANFSTEVNERKSIEEILDERIDLQKMDLPQSSYIVDRNGEIISEIHRPVHRVYVSSDKIPTFMKQIFIQSEDQNFYQHPGFDLGAITRALTINIQSHSIVEGASTITQQLARHLYLHLDKTYNRKLSEVLYAYQLERYYSKDEILELYLNTIYFHNGAYGVEAAANTYFQKSVNELTLAEQAFLAAIPNNPTLYNPLKNKEKTKERQIRLIKQMEDSGILDHGEAVAIINEPIHLNVKERIDRYPDYVTYVEEELKELIAVSEGLTDGKNIEELPDEILEKIHHRVEEVMASGIIIETSLDPTLQENAVNQLEKYLPHQHIQGAIVVIDHNHHEILSLVGGKNYKKYDFNRAFQAYRQPGSTIKPLIAYAPYIDRTKASLDKQINGEDTCYNTYCPKNYGGTKIGMISLEKAFMHSYNTPAVRMLYQVGVEEAFQDLTPFKFQKISKQDYRLPAAIGGFTYGMTPLELTRAFTVFANDGHYKTSRAIRQVTDLKGNVLYAWKEEPIHIWEKNTIEKMRTLLQKAVSNGTGRKAYFPTNYIGGKTGTTNDYHDYWFIGLTDNITAGVWIGKDQPESIKAIESRSPHLHIWREIVSNDE